MEELDGDRASYSFEDAMKANAILDMQRDLELMARTKGKDSS